MDDAISRQHFDERVRLAGGMADEELTQDFKDGVLTVLELLKTEPSVQPEQKMGHWEYLQYDKPSIGNWHCSKCGRIVFLLKSQKSGENPLYDYCPWCGAKMKEGE